ncbi:MAG: hypothetical protein A2234_07475 [Elusimicrobia bacterium RIFOXYA2_FULL_58_8]|nr:MAG: hypothetical protein A2234_07475 [Elusimicrobia bacterium RIFOXYA2_FULL_58_8]OGS13709.1 MAG: hypothetical protein A2285_01240 [Elusimicrobia bacterium RIFOXYA12_FULL_57_11]
MKIGISILWLCVLAFSAAAVCAETIILKTGEELEAAAIIPAGRVLQVKLRSETINVKKTDLTPEQLARYLGSDEGTYLSFTTMKVANNLEYTYYYNGKYAGMRLTDADGQTLRYTGGIPNGTYREFYPGDAVKKEQPLAGNLRNGPVRTYFQDGSLRDETWFLDDAPNGFHRVFDNGGNLISEVRYRRGKRDWRDAVRDVVKPVPNEKTRPAGEKYAPRRTVN